LLHVTVATVAGLTLGAVFVGAWFLRRNRACKDCGTALDVLAAPDGLHTYEVLACPSCPNAEVLSRGVRNRFAFCPRCGRGALQTVGERLPDPPGQRLVRVQESCQMCGYTDIRFVSSEVEDSEAPEPPTKKGDVLPFRRD
jgi:uncharacterized protein (DUF983 family)